MKNKYTSLDVAFEAGVSQATVSRALRNSPVVSPETSIKIKEIAARMNYVVDKNASNLRTQSNNTIALLIFKGDPDDKSIISPFFSSILGSITDSCLNNNIDLLISFQQSSSDWYSSFERNNKADGVILLGYGERAAYQCRLETLIEKQIHFVTWGFNPLSSKISSVCTDNFKGGFIATEHLVSRNHQKIAFIGDISARSPESQERYRGLCKSLNQRKIKIEPCLQIPATGTEESGYQAIKRLLSQNIPFSAVFAGCDRIALGVLLGLSEHGYKVPQDISVIGFDDIPSAKFCCPPLTTISQPKAIIGQQLVEKLLLQIKGEKPTNEVIPVQLIKRLSCGYHNHSPNQP